MSKVAFVFPGQGSQAVGMGKEAHDASDVARAVFEQANTTLGESLSGLCFEGPQEALTLTRNAQPALVTVSTALLRMLDEPCDAVAGHSLGEYAANVAAGTLSFESVVKLVRQRGDFMQSAVPVGVGAMAAVLRAEADAVVAVCDAIDGVVEPVNFNCPGQIVIAGDAAAVAAAGEALNKQGARVKELPVSAPFHSSLMRPAEDNMRPVLEQEAFADPSVPIFTNVDAAPATTASACQDALVRQISRPVLWEQSVRAMLNDGITLFVEIGAGKVLTTLLARIDRDADRVAVNSPADILVAKERIARHREMSC